MKGLPMHRRSLLAAIPTVSLFPVAAARGASLERRPILLVHGMFGGGWVWRFVTPELERRGHRVFTPTLTGVGERSHLLSREVTLDVHIEDVVNMIDMLELTDFTLVGHSYGGMVVTGVADRLRDRVRRLIYLDALIPEDGENAFALLPGDLAGERRTAVARYGAGVAFPVPDASAVPLPENEAKDWFMRHLRPHPVGTYETPVRLRQPAGSGLRVTYVAYEKPALESIAPSRQRAREKAGWEYLSRPVPHDAEVADPELVAGLIADRA
ncbi:alpha/beta hydrolase [Brytella acorum]|uniref:Alpha/beta hydrolase n=1 Tax=Brytella acorum TaxID=2959299 RepID=A0AA35XVW4_9PROT|nr:alpha/beta hydrolase [Brytella acorum]MDF3624866.1 alpha/beta hydrolase [Brytella acorum]CAI9120169.1 alpha/beta hydrolase [Brytella acorum]